VACGWLSTLVIEGAHSILYLSRRGFLRALGASTAGAALVGWTSFVRGGGAPAKRPPNVVIIFTDDQGYQDVGCFGSPLIRTPNLDRMAEEGVRFTDFYVAASVCSPSRAALMTGCYAQRINMNVFPRIVKGQVREGGVVQFPSTPSGLHPDEITLADILKGCGYATACVGKWHLAQGWPVLLVPILRQPLPKRPNGILVPTAVDHCRQHTKLVIGLCAGQQSRPEFVLVPGPLALNQALHVLKGRYELRDRELAFLEIGFRRKHSGGEGKYGSTFLSRNGTPLARKDHFRVWQFTGRKVLPSGFGLLRCTGFFGKGNNTPCQGCDQSDCHDMGRLHGTYLLPPIIPR